MQNIMDDACEEFVEKLWKVIVFEDMKIRAGMYSQKWIKIYSFA
jgi:hypothetical protein